jgi:hypothetical protein
VRAQSSDLGLAAMNFGLAHLGQSVTLGTAGPDGKFPVVIYDKSAPPPKGAFFPACANFVWAALQTVGAKTTGDFGVVDPPGWPANTPSPTDYKWGDTPVLTFHPKSSPISDLSAVKPGDVLQFREVGTKFGPIHQHTAIVVANLGNGRLRVVQQNFAFQTWVTSDPTLDVHDFNTYSGGTVWVYRPVPRV